MNILVLNGSPRPNGNTSAMVKSFSEGAKEAGHTVTVLQVGNNKIAGCLGCEYCHTKGDGVCIQKDDMQEVYAALEQCVIHRTYAIGVPPKLKKAALILSSGSDGVYDAAIRQYQDALIDYMEIEDAGIITAYGSQNQSAGKLKELLDFGRSL